MLPFIFTFVFTSHPASTVLPVNVGLSHVPSQRLVRAVFHDSATKFAPLPTTKLPSVFASHAKSSTLASSVLAAAVIVAHDITSLSSIVIPLFCNSLPPVQSKRAIALSVADHGQTTSQDHPQEVPHDRSIAFSSIHIFI